ncbi:hypothetical protein [Tunturiibacter gelidoferens]|uniref:Uncharacterized protein n=1 Tax=Tunturiibacter gelidiferens TaxID=3069689 RepID=A0ACC5NUM4_9BACT|nr:hypothetical protein [Edaphobacter lichenicola]MBB5338278.1 hypothetical protein [Edaphobacter lichenicola]
MVGATADSSATLRNDNKRADNDRSKGEVWDNKRTGNDRSKLKYGVLRFGAG